MEKSFLLHFTIVRNYIFSLLYLRTFYLLYCVLHQTMALQQFFSLKPLMAVLRQREKQERKKTHTDASLHETTNGISISKGKKANQITGFLCAT